MVMLMSKRLLVVMFTGATGKIHSRQRERYRTFDFRKRHYGGNAAYLCSTRKGGGSTVELAAPDGATLE
jgi:hypothetical protein